MCIVPFQGGNRSKLGISLVVVDGFNMDRAVLVDILLER